MSQPVSYFVYDRTSGYEFRNVRFVTQPQKGDIVLIQKEGYTSKDGEYFVIEDVVHLDFDGKEVTTHLCVRKVAFSIKEGLQKG